jgi:hypothetical protein
VHVIVGYGITGYGIEGGKGIKHFFLFLWRGIEIAFTWIRPPFVIEK